MGLLIHHAQKRQISFGWTHSGILGGVCGRNLHAVIDLLHRKTKQQRHKQDFAFRYLRWTRICLASVRCPRHAVIRGGGDQTTRRLPFSPGATRDIISRTRRVGAERCWPLQMRTSISKSRQFLKWPACQPASCIGRGSQASRIATPSAPSRQVQRQWSLRIFSCKQGYPFARRKTLHSKPTTQRCGKARERSSTARRCSR